MLARTTNLNDIDYKNYGERGIEVCDEWKISYLKFKEWAIDNGYNNASTIERVNVNKGYSPNNCTWISKSHQARNKRNSILIKINDKTECLKIVCNNLGLKYDSIRYKINKSTDTLSDILGVEAERIYNEY